MTIARKILIIGPAWVGDMVMAQCLFISLKQQDPDVIIDVLAPQWSAPLLARMPQVRQALTMPLGHGQFDLKQRWQLGRSLKKEGYQQAIVLPNSWKSALIPLVAGIPQRTGWLGEWRWGLLNDVRLLDKQQWPLMIERFLALGLPKEESLVKPYPRPQFQVNATDVAAAISALNLQYDSAQPILALCPGAEFGPAKRWPETHYAEVARAKLAEGWQVWLFGSKNDQSVATDIQQLTEHGCVDLTGKTSLGQAIDLLSLATAVVSNDSGLMHIAAALSRPLVVPYGSSSPKFTPPLHDQVKILSLNLACSPCFKRECPLPKIDELKCLRDLPAASVLTALDELLC